MDKTCIVKYIHFPHRIYLWISFDPSLQASAAKQMIYEPLWNITQLTVVIHYATFRDNLSVPFLRIKNLERKNQLPVFLLGFHYNLGSNPEKSRFL